MRRAFAIAGLSVLTVAGALAVTAAPAHAATTWFVAMSGSNANPCTTAAAPCATLQGVLNKGAAVVNGDTINVRPGTYPMTLPAQRVGIFKSLTIQREPGHAGAVVFDGGNVPIANTSMFAVAAPAVTLRDLTLQGGNGGLQNSGAALFVFSGSVTAENLTFERNKAPSGNGGAVLVWPGASYAQTGGAFVDNSAANGGAVYVHGAIPPAPGGTASFTDVTFTRNTALGGGVSAAGNGGAIYSSGATSVTGGTFVGNGVNQSINGHPRRGYGGSIFNGPTDAADAPTLAIDGASFSGAPPAVLPLGVHATVGGAIANVALVGPAVNGTTPGVLDGTDVSVSGASAILGGAIYTSGTADLDGGTLSGNSAKPFNGIGSFGTGGGLYNAGTAHLTGTTVSGNTATGDAGAGTGTGGGVYNIGSIRLSGAVVSDNQAVGGAGAPSGRGGGLFSGLVGTAVATVDSGTTITGNTASGTGNGGGVLSEATLTVTDADVSGNSATGSGAASTGLGGGIYSQVGTLSVTGSTVTGNTATGGAGANSGLGGGIFNLAGPATITGSSVDGNTAAGNLASGGGLNNFLGVATVTDTTFSDNTAVAGGGITSSHQLTLHGVAVADNDAASAAGVFNTATLTGTDVTISGNTATATAPGTGFGGGIYNTGAATLTGGSIAGNTAAHSGQVIAGLGGGAFNGGAAASLALRQVRLTDNEATGAANLFQTGAGGAVYNGSNAAGVHATLVVDQSTLDANTALGGSVVFSYAPGADSDSAVSITRSTVTGNTGNGVIALSTGSSGSIVESTVAGNTSGLVRTGDVTVAVAGTILSGNGGCVTIGGGDGAWIDGGYNLVDPGDTTCGLSANVVEADPALAPLADNGGPTPTRALSPASPALDRIPADTATGASDAVTGEAIVLCTGAPDQRGSTRPSGARCDIGAFELGQQGPEISGPATGTFTVGTPGELGPFTATGVPVPTFSAVGLPAGLTLASTGPGTAEITGTPAAGTAGVHEVTVTATNEAGSADLPVTLTVQQAPTVSAPASARFVAGGPAGSVAITSTGFPAPTITVVGDLPAGLVLTPGAPGEATISGTATGPVGTYPVTVRATNAAGSADTVVTIEVVPPLAITTTALPGGSIGVPYSATVAATGGQPPYTFAVDGSLPAGLTLDPATGAISGTPTGTPATTTFTVSVTDAAAPAQVDTQELSITIGKGPTTLTVNPVLIQRFFNISFGFVSATLRGGTEGLPIPGQTVEFYAGRALVCTGVTAADGTVVCTMTAFNTFRTILNLGVTARYAGNEVWLPSTGRAPLL